MNYELGIKKMFWLFLFVSFFVYLVSSPLVYAQQSDLERQLGAFAGQEGAGYAAAQDPRLVAAGLIRISLTIIGILFVVYAVYAGFLIMTARGEEEKVTIGKKTLTRAVVGVAIVMLAYSATLFVSEALRRATSDDQSDYNIRIEEGRRPPPSRDPLAP